VDVLVLCRANVARSPLAEVMLAAADLPGVRVASAGVRARDGYPAAEESQRLATERGLDLGHHRSLPATPDLIARADLVLTMSESIRDLASPLAPRAAAKVFTLREFVRLTDHLTEHLDPHLDPHLDAHLDAPAATHPEGALGWLRDEAHLARPLARRPSSTEDVADPMGRSWDRWVEMGRTLDELVGRIVTLARGTPRSVGD
jgi:protein-tyrosine phosphatase